MVLGPNSDVMSSPFWAVFIRKRENCLMVMMTMDDGHLEALFEIWALSRFVKRLAKRPFSGLTKELYVTAIMTCS